MDPVIQELHAAYLEGTEPMLRKPTKWYNHYWGRGWRRGDVVKLKNKKKILITSGHPCLTYVTFNIKNRLSFFFQEAKTLFRRVVFNEKPVYPQGITMRISTQGVSLFAQTLTPYTPVSQKDREAAS